MSVMVALFYLRCRKVGTEFSQQTAASDSDDASSYSAKLLFKFRQVRLRSPVCLFLTNSVRPSVIVASLMALQKQDKRTTRVGKVQGNLRIGSSLTDKVTKSYFD